MGGAVGVGSVIGSSLGGILNPTIQAFNPFTPLRPSLASNHCSLHGDRSSLGKGVRSPSPRFLS